MYMVKLNRLLGDDKNNQTIQEEASRIIRLSILPLTEPPKSKTMRILYGVVGEGMGHATRSKVILEMLMKEQHHVKVVVSNRAYKFLDGSFPNEAKKYDPKAFSTYKAFVQAKLPDCDQYIITGFFYPHIRDTYQAKTMLVPPILRQAILDAKTLPAGHGEHFLVYQTSKSDTSLIATLEAFGEKCIIYGHGREEKIGNLEFKGFSEQGFVDDLARAKGVIANGGLSLMNEALCDNGWGEIDRYDFIEKSLRSVLFYPKTLRKSEPVIQ
ncbi:unnamed protein product [Didymodactylos carnosus]|uniref:Uncharacterized protein n=1 Tax=Didymodactylos carnosus TaxID=1234261 RepID=A0A815JL80_9BILA|nr:unnamed protein product [Didymodactylos carnosus]CAF4275544.1 unnamed protein product [Didymodactylos carnosus]